METKEKQEKLLKVAKLFDEVCIDNNINYVLGYGSVLGAVRHKGYIPWDWDMDVLVPINEYEKLRVKLSDRLNSEEGLVLHMWDKEKKYCESLDRLSYEGIRHEILHFDIFFIIGAPSSKFRQKMFSLLCITTSKFLRCKHCNAKYSKPKNRFKIRFLKIFAKLVPDKIIIRWYKHLFTKYDLSKSEYGYVLGSKKFVKKEIYYDTIRTKFENITLSIPKRFDEYLTIVFGEDYMTPKMEK